MVFVQKNTSKVGWMASLFVLWESCSWREEYDEIIPIGFVSSLCPQPGHCLDPHALQAWHQWDQSCWWSPSESYSLLFQSILFFFFRKLSDDSDWYIYIYIFFFFCKNRLFKRRFKETNIIPSYLIKIIIYFELFFRL